MGEVWDGRIAIIGVGQIGTALLKGLLQAGCDPDGISVATRNPQHAAQVAAEHGVAAASATSAVGDASLVFVAVRQAQVVDSLTELAPHLAPGAVVVSLAGSPDLATMAGALPAGTPLLRVMPNPAMAVGAGLSGVCPAPDCPAEVTDRVRRLIGRLGKVLNLSEEQLVRIGSLSGHGQAVLYYVADAIVAWGVLQGFTRAQAREVVAGTVADAAAMLAANDVPPAELQHQLCTPGGSTIRSMSELDDRGVRGSIIASMDGGRYQQ